MVTKKTDTRTDDQLAKVRKFRCQCCSEVYRATKINGGYYAIRDFHFAMRKRARRDTLQMNQEV